MTLVTNRYAANVPPGKYINDALTASGTFDMTPWDRNKRTK